MKAEITKNGIEIRPENEAESWALLATFPVGENPADWARKIIIHGEVKEACDE